MIAEVYPLRRMPRTFKHLDYAVPEGWTLRRGAFVLIPFRAQKVIGIVKRVKDIPPRGIVLKSIVSVYQEIFLQETELSFFELCACDIAQSVSSLLYTSLPLPPKRAVLKQKSIPDGPALTIAASESSTIARIAFQMSERREAFISVPDLKRTAAIIARYLYQHPTEKAVIVCPSVRDALLISQALQSHEPWCVTGEETNNERFAVWQSFRKETRGLLIVTRAALFYADTHTTTIFVIRATQASHVQHERNPRLDSRKITRAFSAHFTTNLFFFDVQPTVTDLVYFRKDHLLTFPTNSSTRWIDATKEKTVSAHLSMCASTVEQITQSLADCEPILLVFNKKGFAARLYCHACQFVFVCSACTHILEVHEYTVTCTSCHTIKPIPLRCPSCQSATIKKSGFGVQQLATVLQKWFPNKQVQIVDADHPTYDPTIEITLATQYFFENVFDPFHPPRFGCVIHLDPDTPLFSSDFRSTQQAVLTLGQWAGVAHACQALFVVQTDQVELFQAFFEDPLAWLENEILARKTYIQPPFAEWIRLSIQEPERRKRELEVHLLSKALSAIPEVRVRPEESSSEPNSANLIVCTTADQLPALLDLFAALDDHYVIDLNAFS